MSFACCLAGPGLCASAPMGRPQTCPYTCLPPLPHPRLGPPSIPSVRYKHSGVVRQLLAAGADHLAVDHNHRTLLMRAARGGQLDILTLLLDKGGWVGGWVGGGGWVVGQMGCRNLEQGGKALLPATFPPPAWLLTACGPIWPACQ